MFLSLKCNKRMIIITIAAVAAIVVLCLLDSMLAAPAKDGDDVSSMQVAAADDTERVQFLAQYGWTVSPTPTEVYEVEIPQTFDEIYETYNDLQRSQGFDLSAYRGMRVKRWSYDITNYPDGIRGVRANLLVYNDRVIGGDVCSVESDGFLHGFRSTGTGIVNMAGIFS